MKKHLFFFSLILWVFQLGAQDQTINGTTFKQDGKVGIGTTTPSGKLQVIGDSGFDKSTRLYLTNGASDFGRTNLVLTGRMQGGNDGWNFGSNARNSIVFSSNYVSSSNQNVGGIGLEQFSIQHEQNTNTLGILSQTGGNTPLFTVSQLGNIGIGTIAPAEKLDINGSLKIPSGGYGAAYFKFNFNSASTNSRSWVVANDFYGWGDFGIYESSNQTSSSNPDYLQNCRFHINRDGNIGVGTTDTKGFKLGVNGDIAALEVKIATYTNWADYVFNKDYNLPTLKEVEHHIKEKGHLKDIPSAEEVKKDGFYLAEMNARLLQKIEELTLYTIEQQKEIEASKKELQNQKVINKNLENKFKEQEARLKKIEALLVSEN